MGARARGRHRLPDHAHPAPGRPRAQRRVRALGEFGSRQAIGPAKAELVQALPEAADGGIAILNANDDIVAGIAAATPPRP